jgi:hypothetical protein
LITGLNFNDKPDLIWIKNRDESIDHTLYDSIRGFGANKELTPNDSYSEGQTGTGKPNTDVWGYVNSNNFNGFTVNKGSNSTPSVVNSNNIKYVAWAWKAGGNKNTFNVDDVGYASAAAAGLTGGSITPTGSSVGTRQGFSIIKYTGTGSNASVSHGLQNIPQFMIVKDRESSSGWWAVYHHSMGNTHALYLNDNQGKVDSSFWNDTTPTSSVFTIGANANTNSSNDFIAYLWHDVPGLQKFGSYEGTGTTTGPYVELGFRPAVVLIKDIDTAGEEWCIYDSQRGEYNPNGATLYANGSNAEYDGNASSGANSRNIDFLSNGFKFHDLGNPVNKSTTHIYAAWAEVPAFGLYGSQSNAR